MFHLCAAVVVAGLIAASLIAAGVPGARAAEGPLRLTPSAPDALLRLEAEFPRRSDVCAARQPRNLHAAYPGILEIGTGSDGKLYLVTELSFDRYLLGIAEVPLSWPLEALKAQVVAARTYAISHMNPNTELSRKIGFNICATDACQVYRGAGVEYGAWGESWARAVSETDGQILEHGGKPASTFFFSTSNGKTYSNSEVFGGTALPYLKPVEEADDQQSPLSKWEVRMSLADLGETLRLAKAWSGEAITSVESSGDSVIVKGPSEEKSLTIADLRRKLNTYATCLTPKRFPSKGPDGKAYPQTIPSLWMTTTQERSEVVFRGRGWGHGVGMVQWGLKGKSEKGMGYADMLAFYYGGLRPVARPEPDKIRVLLATGIERIRFERRSSVSTNIDLPDGPVAITPGSGLTIAAAEPIEPVLSLSKVAIAPKAAPDQPAVIDLDLSSPAKITIAATGPDGTVHRTLAAPMDRGPGKLSWGAGAEVPAEGVYTLRVEADDGVDSVVSPDFSVAVVKPTPSPSPSRVAATRDPELPGKEGDRSIYLAALAAALLLAAGFAAARKRMR